MHPTQLHVRSLPLALEFGSLKLIQWVIENRHDRQCCPPGIENLCPVCLKDFLFCLGDMDMVRALEWFITIGPPVFDADKHLSMFASRTTSAKLLEWLDARGKVSAFNYWLIFINALRNGNYEALQFLLEHGFTPSETDVLNLFLVPTCRRRCQAAMDLVITSRWCDTLRDKFVWAATRPGGLKILQWEEAETMVGGLQNNVALAHSAYGQCNVDTLEWLRVEHGILEARTVARDSDCEENPLALYKWMALHGVDGWLQEDVIVDARRCYLDAIQWIYTHKPHLITSEVLDQAAYHGHFNMLEWLYTNSNVRCSAEGLYWASKYGHLKIIQFLLANELEGDINIAMANAVVNGHLDVVAWLCANRVDACSACVLRTVLRGYMKGFTTMPAPLDPVRWLTRHNCRALACQDQCLNPLDETASCSLVHFALRHGDLDLARYLLDEHGDSFWKNPDQEAVAVTIVSSGHLPLMQWLEATYPGRVDWHEALQSVPFQPEQFHIREWLEHTVANTTT